jgi:SMI1 / KNR4 family (SUKH-1)
MGLQAQIFQIREMKGVQPREAATPTDIAATERRLGVRVPTDVREFWLVMNGSEGSTPVEHGWLTFWPLEQWQTVAALGLDGSHRHAVVFADHGLDAWHCAFEAEDADDGARIIRIDGSDQVVSETFTAFIDAVVRDDRKLYR